MEVQYESRGLTRTNRFYSMLEEETAAVVFALKTFEHHLPGDSLILFSDYRALQTAFGKVSTHGRLAL